jgi:acetoin utilization protein AcuB
MEPMATIHPAAEVRDIMTAQVHTLHLDDSLRTAASLFEREHFHHVVVLERGRVHGVVSDRDILKAVSPFVGNPMLERPQDASTLKKRVHQIMTRKPVTIGGDQSITAAADVMLTQRVSCLPVVDDDGKLLGIVTVRDLLAQLAAPHPAS